MMTTKLVYLGTALALLGAQAESVKVENTRLAEDEQTGLRVIAGQVELPSRGLWELAQVGQGAAWVRQVSMQPPQVVWTALEGDRMGRLRDRQALAEGRQHLSQLGWACREYAEQHNGRGPKRLTDLDEERFRFMRDQAFEERFVLVPDVRLPARGQRLSSEEEAKPLAFEVQPALDDGKHWVLWSDGRVERRDVDPEWVAHYKLVIRPKRPSREMVLAELGQTVVYDLYGLRAGEEGDEVTLTLTNGVTAQVLECVWPLSEASGGEETLVGDWAGLRAAHWRAINDAHPSLALSLWLQQSGELYGLPTVAADSRPRGPVNRTTVFNVLGGRAAIRETLQMQDLNLGEADAKTTGDMVDLKTIRGVEVKAHPYETMLEGREGGQLQLAEMVPHDRFFAYFPRPDALVKFLDSGSEFAFQLSSGFQGRSIRYGLLERYLSRMGLTEDSMRSLLESGAMSEVGMFLPDLFLIDGTDVTIVAKLGNPSLAAPILRLMGLGDDDRVTVLQGAGGAPVYWARRQQWILISSSRDELEASLSLQSRQGEGSLGRSAEFRAMLLELPLRETTRGYLYFSDPFIRRLTGPEVKIGQLRRLLARGQMEAATAGALLYRLDHGRPAETLDSLTKAGYVPQVLDGIADMCLEKDLRVTSARYGTPSAMVTLLELPVDQVTQAEAQAYAMYRANYERFWRQFFDPIAVRLDQTGPKDFALETFILPLIDSSIYRVFRERIATAESGVALRVPVLDPEPVTMLSVNLTDPTWVEWLDDLDDWLLQFVGLRSDVLDQLGPSLHLALADADPIVNTGSGDLLASFGADGRRFGNDMFTIPAFISLLTRPSSLLLEVKDPALVREALRRLPLGELPRQRGFLGMQNALYQVGDRDEWIYTLSFEGVIKLRYGVSLQDSFLVISNLPLTHRPTLQGVREAANNGVWLGVAPRAAKLLLPSLYAAASERQRGAAMEGVSMLYPVLQSNQAGLDRAASVHHALFGFAPLHPAGGQYELEDGVLASSVYGRPGKERQPPYSPGDRAFGIFQRIERMDLGVQFEQEGLRAQCRWTAH